MGITVPPEVGLRKSIENFVQERSFEMSNSANDVCETEVEHTIHGRKIKASKNAWDSFSVYCQYDDWASETAKTDYTYSRLSKCRKNDSPDELVRPNLSRRSFRQLGSQDQSFSCSTPLTHTHNRFLNTIISESYITSNKDTLDGELTAESDVELKVSWSSYFSRIFTFISSLFVASSMFCRRVARSLYSQVASTMNWRRLLWFLLVPLLLCAGCYYGSQYTAEDLSSILFGSFSSEQTADDSLAFSTNTPEVILPYPANPQWEDEKERLRLHYEAEIAAIRAEIDAPVVIPPSPTDFQWEDEKEKLRLHHEADLRALRAEIDGLEEKLHLKHTKFLEENINTAMNQYRISLQEHTLSFNAALRRCCSRRPQVITRYIPSPIPDTSIDAAKIGGDSLMDLDEVRRIVADAIRIYDADKTGRADYALESSGGRVVSIRCTKAYRRGVYLSQWLPFFAPVSPPEIAIRGSVSPGECWPFQGSVGFLALELSHSIRVSGFTLEHIAAELNPSGTIDSAPKHFSMWGLQHADDIYDQYLFGEYIYEDNGNTVQYFPVSHASDQSYKFVELKIVSNHGHPDYTCLYRIRVHGTVT